MFLRKNLKKAASLKVECGKMEWNDSKKYSVIFGGGFILAGIIMATVIFPFWNLIREDVFEETEIFSNVDGTCYVNTSDQIPKTIKNCNVSEGTPVTIKYGEGLAWATIIES